MLIIMTPKQIAAQPESLRELSILMNDSITRSQVAEIVELQEQYQAHLAKQAAKKSK